MSDTQAKAIIVEVLDDNAVPYASPLSTTIGTI